MSYDEEIDRILKKAFEDVRKRINTLLAKREKNLLRDMKITTTAKLKRDDREKEREKKDKKKSKKRGSSSSSGTSESD
jgi:hypothetical protein